MTRVSQLRTYTIRKGKMDEWIEGWRHGVVPLRRKHGFRIDGAWVAKDEDVFIWILTYDGPEEWGTKNDAYYSSHERKSLDPDPARLIVQTREMFITPVARE
jgi:hypothetical protein